MSVLVRLHRCSMVAKLTRRNVHVMLASAETSQEWRTRRMTLQCRRKVCPFGRIRILTNVNVQCMVRSPTERRALPALQRATRAHLRLRQ